MIVGTWLKFTTVSALALAVAACVVESEPPPRRSYPSSPAPPGVAGTLPSASASSAASPTPILVSIDTDRTMDADPGEGVGIFTEYKAGGHWHLWWSCDTNQTQKSCPFEVRVRSEKGTFSKVEGDHLLEGDSIATSAGSTEVRLKTVTTTNVAGVYVDTAPGEVIEVTGFVGAMSDPAFFFFVQDGKVNGGYEGKLSNPIRFQGTKP